MSRHCPLGHLEKGFPVKNLIALGLLGACALLTACGPDSGSVTTIDSAQVRPPAADGAKAAPPGDGIKLGSNSGTGAPPPKAKPE